MSDLQQVKRTDIVRSGGSTNLHEVLNILFRRRWIVISIAVPIMLFASLGLFRRTKAYVAGCQMLIELRAPRSTSWNPSTAQIDEDRTLSTYSHMAMSVPVATSAASAMQDSLPIIIARNPELQPLRRFEKLVEYLVENVDMDQLGESNILALQFRSVDMNLALMSVRKIRDAFMDFTIHARQNDSAMEYYEEQVDEVRSDIDSLLANRSEILMESGYANASDDMRFEAGRLSDLESQYFKTMTERTYLESKLLMFREAFAENPDFFPVGDRALETQPLVDAKQYLEMYRRQLNELLSSHPAGSAMVKRAEELVAGADKIYHDAIADYLVGLEVAVEAERQKEVTRKSQIDGMRKALRLAPGVYRQITLIDTEIGAKRGLLEDLQVKSGEVRLDAMADERVSRIIKLTEPEIMRVVSGSKMMTYFALVSIMGLLFSFTVAFAIDRQDHKIYSPATIEEHLEIPVLGVVTDAREENRS